MLGQVYRLFYQYCQIAIGDQLVDCLIPNSLSGKIVVGDYLEVKLVNHQYVAQKINKRYQYCIRPKCANIDLILVIYPAINAKSQFHDLLWLLVNYQSQNLPVVVVFSKTDLLSETDYVLAPIKRWLQQLAVNSYDYHRPEELVALINFLNKQLVALAGYSGAGKSTFLKYLNPKWSIKTQPLSAKNTGKHTTTTINIYSYGDLKLIDTPGFSTINFNFTPITLSRAWTKFREWQINCKFNNCLHNKPEEIFCGVIQALNNGLIDQQLYEIYLSFLKTAQRNNYFK